jgi:hypothetical protein
MTLNVAGTLASVEPPEDPPADDPPPEPEIGAPPELAPPEPETEAPPDPEPFAPPPVLAVVAACAVVELEALAPGAVVLPAALWLVLECEEPPHPAMVRKVGRSAERARRRLTFSA